MQLSVPKQSKEGKSEKVRRNTSAKVRVGFPKGKVANMWCHKTSWISSSLDFDQNPSHLQPLLVPK